MFYYIINLVVFQLLDFEELRDLAKHTIGHHFNYNDLILSSALQIVNTLERQIESIEKEILAIMEELHSPIDTIPGESVRLVLRLSSVNLVLLKI